MQFVKATKERTFLRMGIAGPAGSGKTYTALRFAHALGTDIALVDSEHGSASKYVGESPDGIPWAFDTFQPDDFAPTLYTAAINMAVQNGYEVLILDSLSHAWNGKGGALEIKDRIGGNSWAAWRKVTPMHEEMVDAILRSPIHIIATMRSKMEHIQEKDENGSTVIRKVGMAPIQRAGMEYEFDIVIDLDWAHIGTVSKSRCSPVADKIVALPGPAFMEPVIAWLRNGAVPQGSLHGSRKWAENVVTPKGSRLGDLNSDQRGQVQRWIQTNGKRHAFPNLATALDMLSAGEEE